MASRPSTGPVPIPEPGLARLMPMYALLSGGGDILAAGPTLGRICGGLDLPGRRFLDLFEVLRPRPAATMTELLELAARKIVLRFRAQPARQLRGHLVPLAGGQGALVNLSLGISAAEAVRDHGLSHADFAPTDLTVELLYLTEVKSAVMGELRSLNHRLQSARRRAEAQALTDPLTGLANRRAFDAALERAVAGSERGVPFSLLHLDLDRFKQVNDTLGHAAGDHVLAEVARVLRGQVRQNDTVARIGGDEFMAILTGATDASVLGRIGGRIIAGIEQPIEFEGTSCRISGSIGVSRSVVYARPAPKAMIEDADAALYRSKSSGRARVTIDRPDGVAAPPEGPRPADGRSQPGFLVVGAPPSNQFGRE
ncbi:GGDEF domain-containing protein [Albidovulum sediminicola]|uniref:GGDEF domain-containing protein n=1 Tax=Albidovulum sediminicola TaxID=2984331 RepID=A0ABT2YXF2_9RHOB|nr:GGDEF domain-containing protein [Defluviimonas sp. WL0075]MCV2863564.1 GGDEF domain-containing protein [Defluviimonas sp. WL0075]